MMRRLMFVAALCCTGLGQAQNHAGHAGKMPAQDHPKLIAGHGNGGFKINTAVPEAQAFFDNGIELAYAFEHKAAASAFAESARLDPQCVMCAWGVAWSSGPTINYAVEDEDLAEASRLAARAAALAMDHGSSFERQMTQAMVLRYHAGGGEGRRGDKAFLKAMQGIAQANAAHDMVQVIAADAAMQSVDWNKEHEVKSGIVEALRLLTPVLARNPDNTAAVHLYIHASEIAGVPLYAEPFADRLATLAPRSQHLVHMPSHTQYWIGRYRDAGLANLRAVTLGQEMAAAMPTPPKDGPFSLTYHAHNVHFGLGGAMIAGDGATALAIARPLLAMATDPKYTVFQKPMRMHLAGKGMTALGLFAPAEVLDGKPPENPILKSYWHYARGEALASRGDAAGVRGEAAAMSVPAIVQPKKDDDGSWIGATILAIGRDVLIGKAAMIEGKPALAMPAFRRAMALEEGKDFSSMVDPPYWWYPVRRSLAEAMLAAGDKAGAREQALETLKRRPKDPGALALITKLDAGP